jgi:hypothetical protein
VVAVIQIYLPDGRIGTSHEHANNSTDKQNSANANSSISSGWMRATYQKIQTGSQANNANRDDDIENYRILQCNSYLFQMSALMPINIQKRRYCSIFLI